MKKPFFPVLLTSIFQVASVVDAAEIQAGVYLDLIVDAPGQAVFQTGPVDVLRNTVISGGSVGLNNGLNNFFVVDIFAEQSASITDRSGFSGRIEGGTVVNLDAPITSEFPNGPLEVVSAGDFNWFNTGFTTNRDAIWNTDRITLDIAGDLRFFDVDSFQVVTGLGGDLVESNDLELLADVLGVNGTVEFFRAGFDTYTIEVAPTPVPTPGAFLFMISGMFLTTLLAYFRAISSKRLDSPV